MKEEINPEVLRRSEALHRLAEALSEDILNTPRETLLAEVAEDHGDSRAFAKAFNRVLGRAVRQSARRRIEDWARALAAAIPRETPWKPVLASIGVILIVALAGDLYVRLQHKEQLQQVAGLPSNPWLGGLPEIRGASERLARSAQQSDPPPSPPVTAPRPAALPSAADFGASSSSGAASASGNPKSVRTVTVRPDQAEPGAPVAAVSPPSQVVQASPQRLATAQPPLATREQPATAPVAAFANAGPEQPVPLAAPPAAANAATSPPSFSWPVRGRIIAGFGPHPGSLRNDGINVAVPEGTDVRAADDGLVVYAGNDVKGYGNLVLVRHSNGFVTAYAHASQLLVGLGDDVRRGQVIAKSGHTGHVTDPQVHFEVRKGTIPVDPLQYLSPG
jgi:murein DD-endopeptidase MepM/ murein hydrolase activator NlpD